MNAQETKTIDPTRVDVREHAVTSDGPAEERSATHPGQGLPPAYASLKMVGDELLSGAVRDENSWFLLQGVAQCGVHVDHVGCYVKTRPYVQLTGTTPELDIAEEWLRRELAAIPASKHR